MAIQSAEEFAKSWRGLIGPDEQRQLAREIAARDAAMRAEERAVCVAVAEQVYALTRDTAAAEVEHLDDGSYQAGPAAYATGMNRAALDISNAIRARASSSATQPEPAEEANDE
jgi:hypothetical protein